MKVAAAMCVVCVLLMATTWCAPRSASIGGVYNPPWFSYPAQKRARPTPPKYGALKAGLGYSVRSDKGLEPVSYQEE